MRAAESKRLRYRSDSVCRATPARQSFAFTCPEPQLESSTTLMAQIQKPPRQLGGLQPISNGASPVASALGFRTGATPRGPIHSNRQPQCRLSKPDISTLPGIGHFYFALTVRATVFFSVFPHWRRLIKTGRKTGLSRDGTRAPIPGPNPAEAGHARLRSRSEAETNSQGRQESDKSWGRRGKAPGC